MTQYLLDSNVMIWVANGEPAKISSSAMSILSSVARGDLLFSIASIWEMQIKFQLGKLLLNEPLDILIEKQTRQNGVEILPIEQRHVYALAQLPPIHRDPFDRMLVAQADIENVTIITSDPIIPQYGMKTVW